ncbi:hypothetical protein ACFXJ8_25955 [Nonomuraea sp. NPDC059194]|uniref:hypothetical protein n=1 Tax=Nonomuraea sp. NPDC059194 TaxID=3346764 RepID=UPI003682C38F
MPLPQSEDFADRIRKIEQEIRDLRSSITNQGGRSEASGGWVFTDMADPPVPTSGKTHIYSQGGRLWARSTTGDVPLLLPPPFPQGSSVTDPILTMGSAPASYTQGYGDTLNLAINEKHNKLIELLNSLRWADLINT